MTRIHVHVPDQDEVLTVEAPPNTNVLLGRDPDPTRLGVLDPSQLPTGPVQAVRISSSRISANHLLMVSRPDTLSLEDLRSRNGCWLRLPAGRPVSTPRGPDLFVGLAHGAAADPLLHGPAAADWNGLAEYPAAVLSAAQAWLRSLGVRATLRMARPPAAPAPEASFPLADGSELYIAVPPDATQDLQWPSVVEMLRGYVNEQNALFDREQGYGHEEGFILASREFRDAHRQIAEAAVRGLRVMLLGPTGAGKEVLAACYHKHSPQQAGPFKALNCGNLKGDLMYARLFGAKRGAYTGCVQDLPGAVELAVGGSLFLDEVGDMGPDAQTALLRFLNQRGDYERLGDPQTRNARSVQIVCATNVDMDEAVRSGRFREDLWYRLAVRVVRVPPLRERREDVLAYLKLTRRAGSPLSIHDMLAPEGLELVLKDPWPGNFRDLKNFVERLPDGAGPHGIGPAVCRAALEEGRISRRPTETLPEGDGPQALGPAGWQEMTRLASAAFAEDQGGSPRSAGQIQIYMEKYLKPVFVAYACGQQNLDEVSRGLNFSSLARQLDIADGTTVKRHLQRYIERYRRRPQGR